MSTPFGDCVDGQVRLVGGNNNSIGRVEVCVNNAWGTVCNARFGTNEARVICRQLNFSDSGNFPLLTLDVCLYVFYMCDHVSGYKSIQNSFGVNSGPIFLENLDCSGLERNLIDCSHSTIGTHQCDHTRDAAVQCYGTYVHT